MLPRYISQNGWRDGVAENRVQGMAALVAMLPSTTTQMHDERYSSSSWDYADNSTTDSPTTSQASQSHYFSRHPMSSQGPSHYNRIIDISVTPLEGLYFDPTEAVDSITTVEDTAIETGIVTQGIFLHRFILVDGQWLCVKQRSIAFASDGVGPTS